MYIPPDFHIQLNDRKENLVMVGPGGNLTQRAKNSMDGKALEMATWRAYSAGKDYNGQTIIFIQSKAFPDYWLSVHREKGYVKAVEDKALTTLINARVPLPVPSSTGMLLEWHIRCTL